jgi:hypothetical protein
MGVDVTLEDENGGVLENLEDSGNCVAKLKAHAATGSSHCLVYIDEYGDTTFNRLQMPRLLEELKEIPKDALDARTWQFLEQIRALAERCFREVHTYLKFSGD